MAITFFVGLALDTKPYYDGNGERDHRYVLVNSRNRNKKIIRSGGTVSTQNLGIDAPTVAPTISIAGAGANLFYVYVYVNKFFVDPLSLEDDGWIRSNRSPVLTAASAGGAPTLAFTLSADPQVTHIWLYVSGFVDGPWSRLLANYEVANTGIPTLLGVTTPPTAGNGLEIDNFVPDTCRIVAESNGFYNLAGFIPITGLGNASTISSQITAIANSSIFDGVIALNFQFLSDVTGGPSNNGIHIAQYVNATTLQLVNADGTNRLYDGPSNKTQAGFRLWRNPSTIQITKRYNPDSIPGIVDPNYLILGAGPVTGIAKPTTGFALRYHYNTGAKKSVELADFTQGVPPRRLATSSPFAMACPRAWVAAGNRLFYWDTQAGVIEDRNMTHVPMTLPVIPNLVRSLNKAATAITEMEYDESRNLLFIAVAPSGYTLNYYMIVYSLTTNTWNLWFMLPDVNAMRRIQNADGSISIFMGSSKGSITSWPSINFNEAVGTSIAGVVAAVDDSTHLTVLGTPFPTAGNKLIDRWVMVWDDAAEFPIYQFGRISDNTSSRLTLDIFIGPNSTVAWSPIPGISWAFWCGPIQCIVGPNWEFNSVPDDDGKIYDVSITTSGLQANQTSRIDLFRNFEIAPSMGSVMKHNLYADGSTDPDHQSWKADGVDVNSVENTGITGWRITDNNEAPLSIKAIVKRVKAVSENLNQRRG